MTGAEILNAIDDFLARYVAFPNAESHVAVTLWIAHAHTVESFESTPRLALLSPEKGSGKTRTLEVLALLVPHPIHASNLSAAALYRLVADRQPTLLLDECDTYLGPDVAKQHEDLRGLVNAGHRRGATVYRGEVTGKTVKVVEFPAYAACALAGLRELPDTIMDRSIVIAMKRRTADEEVEPFRERIVRPTGELLHARIAEWAAEHADQLQQAWPELPDGIVDRAADVWEPLLAVADAAGGDWPQLAREAAVALCKAREERDPSLNVLLLTDCRTIFERDDADRLTTEILVQALIDLAESPWGDIRGKPIDARRLARRLRQYEVRPGVHRFGEDTARGYLREDFHDAWQRYLPPPPVTDVTDVTHAQRERGRADDVTDTSHSSGRGGTSIPLNISLCTPGEASQAKQAQHSNGHVDLTPDDREPLFEDGHHSPATDLAHDLEPTPDHDEDHHNAPDQAELERLLHDHADIADGAA